MIAIAKDKGWLQGCAESNLHFTKERCTYEKALHQLQESSLEWECLSDIWRCQENAANISVEETCDIDVRLETELAALKSLVAKLVERGKLEQRMMEVKKESF